MNVSGHEKLGREAPAVFDAVRMRLIELGEAANGIPAAIRQYEPGLPWAEVIGMRNWMAHRYFDSIYTYVWATVDDDLAPLPEGLDRLECRLRDSDVATDGHDER